MCHISGNEKNAILLYFNITAKIVSNPQTSFLALWTEKGKQTLDRQMI